MFAAECKPIFNFFPRLTSSIFKSFFSSVDLNLLWSRRIKRVRGINEAFRRNRRRRIFRVYENFDEFRIFDSCRPLGTSKLLPNIFGRHSHYERRCAFSIGVPAIFRQMPFIYRAANTASGRGPSEARYLFAAERQAESRRVGVNQWSHTCNLQYAWAHSRGHAHTEIFTAARAAATDARKVLQIRGGGLLLRPLSAPR